MTQRTIHRSLLASAVLLASSILPATALAEGPLDDGLRFHVSGVFKSTTAGLSAGGRGPGSFGGPGSPVLSNRIGLSTGSFGGWTTLGFSRSGVHIDGQNTTAQTIDVGLGGRYLMKEPGKAKPAPYIYGQAVTKRASADTDSDDLNDLLKDFNRYSLSLGFGGEVALSKGMSLSAEVGLNHDVVSYDEKDARFMAIQTTIESGIAANVYF
jgi:hypothetical protein